MLGGFKERKSKAPTPDQGEGAEFPHTVPFFFYRALVYAIEMPVDISDCPFSAL